MSHESQDGKVGSALIVGGGIGGMQAALDLAAGGIKVYLAESKSAIGGVMSQLDKTFPTNDCAMCTQAPRLVEIGRHKDIDVISLADIESVRGVPGNFTVTLKKRPRFVDEERCTGCGTCVSNCPARNSVQIAPPVKAEIEPEFKEQVVAIVARHKDRKGPLMPILQEINGALKYFPESVLRYVSQETGLPPRPHLQDRHVLRLLQRDAAREAYDQRMHGHRVLREGERNAHGEIHRCTGSETRGNDP